MTKPRRFRLDIVGELEDRPRLLRAYGRVRGAELAVVLRPTEQRALFVLLGKESCVLWKHELEPGEKRTVGKLRLGKKTEIQVGSRVMQIVGELPAGLAKGQVVPVAVKSGRVRVLVGGDAPRVGTDEVVTADAVVRVKAMQRGLPPKGPMTLRGRWTGALVWDGVVPSIELKRKLAAYGTLVCRSTPMGWSWTFERAKRWYSGEKREEGSGYDTLMDAIEAGLTAAMRLVREACGVRDTSRRAALDDAWAATHPIAMPRERANPVEKLGAKGCGCKAKDEVTGLPEYDRMPRERGESAYGYARRMVSEANARVGEGHHRVAEDLLKEAERQAASLSGSKAQRVYEYVDHVRGKLSHYMASNRPSQTPEVEKDAILVAAFREAVRLAGSGRLLRPDGTGVPDVERNRSAVAEDARS